MKHLQTASTIKLRRLGKLALPLALAALSGTASASDTDKTFTVGGFGTLGMTRSTNQLGDYTNGPFQPKGTGASSEWTPGVDSLLAVQIDGKFTDKLTGVVQVISSLNTHNNYQPHIEWANLKYAFTPNLSVRIGRIALPVFMISDTRLVGYANTWVRAPLETYSMYALTNNDGVDASWSHSIAGYKNTVQAWYGRTKVDSVNANGSVTDDIWSHNMRGISDTIEKGALTVRVGAHFSDLQFYLPATKQDFDLSTRTYNLGAIYDPGTWFIQGEVTKSLRTSVLPRPTAKVKDTSVTALAGYRIDKFTPYVLFSRSGAPDPATKASREQRTKAIGVRYDAYKNIDVKFQLDRVQLGDKSTAFFTNVKPGLAGSSGNVASLVVDFIY